MLKSTCGPLSDLESMVLPFLRILEIKRQLNYWDNPYYLDNEDLCYHDVELNETTFSGCKNLGSLVLFDCVLGNSGVVISAPKLDNLELGASFFGLTFIKLELCTPNLKAVELQNVIPFVKMSSYYCDFVYINKFSNFLMWWTWKGTPITTQLMEEGISQLLRAFT